MTDRMIKLVLAIANLKDRSFDGLAILDVTNSNPNGDPDNGGKPRQQFMKGIISPESFKRKFRDLVEDPAIIEEARKELGLPKTGFEILESHKSKGLYGELRGTLLAMTDEDFLDRFWDARVFGCTLLDDKGQEQDDGEAPEAGADKPAKKGKKGKKGKATVKKMKPKAFRGALTVGVGESICPVDVHASTTTQKTGCSDTSKDDEPKDRGMAPDALCHVQHGLYPIEFYYRAVQGSKNRVTDNDLRLFMWILEKVYDQTKSVRRASVHMINAYVGVHKSRIGTFSTFKFLDAVKPEPLNAGAPSESKKDYKFADLSAIKGKINGEVFDLID